MTTTERNKATVRRFLEGTHGGRPEVVDETVAPHIRTHGFPGGDPDSRDSYKRFFEGLEAAFPNMDFRIDAMAAEGAMVAVRWTVSAVHRGPFLGRAPTGCPVTFDGMVLYRMEDGLIAETWLYPDNQALARQLAAAA